MPTKTKAKLSKRTKKAEPAELEFASLLKLNKDLKDAATLMRWDEARYLVDLYYQLQRYRLATNNQIRSAELEPNSLLGFFAGNFRSLEANVKAGLKAYISQFSVGQWAMSVCGIGEVLASGFLTLLDIRRAPTVGHFYSFAGISPHIHWGKGEKRPYCADLKTLSFKAGDCFVKFQNSPKDFYGQFYVSRKAYEVAKNERKEYAEQAEIALQRVGKTTEAYKHYKIGQLPPGHLHSRARRYAVKMFLSHLHHVMHVDYYDKPPQFPFPMTEWPGVHTHFVELPNWPFEFVGKSLKQMYGEK